MTSNPGKRFLSVAITLMLSACIGRDDNSSTTGLVVHVGETHVLERVPAIPASRIIAAHESSAGGYDIANLEHHEIRDENNRKLAIYRAFIVLNNIELVPCHSIASLPGKLLGGLVKKAYAHAGHGSEPVGGRALDAPNVIDIITQEGYILPLGDMSISPGIYCGMRVSLSRLASYAYGKPDYMAASIDDPVTEPEIPDLSGAMFAIRADYCDTVDGLGRCTHRTRVDIDDTGLAEPVARVVEFSEPLEVSAKWREGYVVVGIHYGHWLENIDITALSSSAEEQNRLLENMVASIYIDSKGLGELPPSF